MTLHIVSACALLFVLTPNPTLLPVDNIHCPNVQLILWWLEGSLSIVEHCSRKQKVGVSVNWLIRFESVGFHILRVDILTRSRYFGSKNLPDKANTGNINIERQIQLTIPGVFGQTNLTSTL